MASGKDHAPMPTSTPFDWHAAAPEDVGFDAGRLEALRAELAARDTHALLVARNDRIACEWYAPGWHADRPHSTASLAKALVGGVSLLIALGDGRLGLDDSAARFIPQWTDDPRKAAITVRHLAAHTSGLEDAEQDELPHERLPGWKGAFWRRDPDPFTLARDAAPVLFPPGSAYAYSNPGMAMLAYCVTAALRGAPQADLRTLLRERVYTPIGLQTGAWSLGYGTTYHVADLPLCANWGGGAFTGRATARVGRLLLRRGDWDGQQLLDAALVDRAMLPAGPAPAHSAADPVPAIGLCFWTNATGVWPEAPHDLFGGAGAGQQVLLVSPSLGLIVVRNGAPLDDPREATFWAGIRRHVIGPLLNAAR